MLRIILLTPIESGTSTWKSLGSYCLFNCWPSVQVWVIKLIISPWFTTPNKTSALNAEPFKCLAFVSVCCQLYCIGKNNYWFLKIRGGLIHLINHLFSYHDHRGGLIHLSNHLFSYHDHSILDVLIFKTIFQEW